MVKWVLIGKWWFKVMVVMVSYEMTGKWCAMKVKWWFNDGCYSGWWWLKDGYILVDDGWWLNDDGSAAGQACFGRENHGQSSWLSIAPGCKLLWIFLVFFPSNDELKPWEILSSIHESASPVVFLSNLPEDVSLQWFLYCPPNHPVY